MRGPSFFSKILLFGEYGIIKGSKGLSIPFNFFKGNLQWMEQENDITLASHKSLCNYVKFLKYEIKDLIPLDWLVLQSDLDHKLYFKSTIPNGYGVGSSGALVAAFYDRYAFDKIIPQEILTSTKLTRLKKIFAVMESYFHGESSGLDPLNSYLSLPLIIHTSDKIETTSLPKQKLQGKGVVFLIDTGSSAETGPMVSLFMNKMKEEGFAKMMEEEFVETPTPESESTTGKGRVPASMQIRGIQVTSLTRPVTSTLTSGICLQRSSGIPNFSGRLSRPVSGDAPRAERQFRKNTSMHTSAVSPGSSSEESSRGSLLVSPPLAITVNTNIRNPSVSSSLPAGKAANPSPPSTFTTATTTTCTTATTLMANSTNTAQTGLSSSIPVENTRVDAPVLERLPTIF